MSKCLLAHFSVPKLTNIVDRVDSLFESVNRGLKKLQLHTIAYGAELLQPLYAARV